MINKIDLSKFKNDLDRDLFLHLWGADKTIKDPTAEVRGKVAQELEELGYSKTLEELASSFFNTCDVKELLKTLDKYTPAIASVATYRIDFQELDNTYRPVLQKSIEIIPGRPFHEDNFTALARIMTYESLQSIKKTLYFFN